MNMDLGPGQSYVFTKEWHADIRAENVKKHRLQSQALAEATWRGHKMATWTNLGLDHSEAICQVCGARVYVDVNPAPNGVEIGGMAVAVNCGD